MTENEELQKVIDEYKEFMRQEKLSLELSNYSEPLRKTTEENIRDIGLEINWLEEIQQYRAIGTVEEIRQKLKNMSLVIDTDRDLLNRYIAIGTIEEFKALKEKSVAKKPNKDEFDRFTCPDCGWIVSTEEYGGRFLPHCENCGQAIDWSE